MTGRGEGAGAFRRGRCGRLPAVRNAPGSPLAWPAAPTSHGSWPLRVLALFLALICEIITNQRAGWNMTCVRNPLRANRYQLYYRQCPDQTDPVKSDRVQVSHALINTPCDQISGPLQAGILRLASAAAGAVIPCHHSHTYAIGHCHCLQLQLGEPAAAWEAGRRGHGKFRVEAEGVEELRPARRDTSIYQPDEATLRGY
jgi:hypothetical protein